MGKHLTPESARERLQRTEFMAAVGQLDNETTPIFNYMAEELGYGGLPDFRDILKDAEALLLRMEHICNGISFVGESEEELEEA